MLCTHSALKCSHPYSAYLHERAVTKTPCTPKQPTYLHTPTIQMFKAIKQNFQLLLQLFLSAVFCFQRNTFMCAHRYQWFVICTKLLQSHRMERVLCSRCVVVVMKVMITLASLRHEIIIALRQSNILYRYHIMNRKYTINFRISMPKATTNAYYAEHVCIIYVYI